MRPEEHKGWLVRHNSHMDADRHRLRQIASIAEAEPLGSAFYYVHVGLLAFGAISVFVLFGMWHFAVIAAIYLVCLTVEKATAARAIRASKPSWYGVVLTLLCARAVAYNALVLAVWMVEGDVFKMAALALLVAATINIFVFHATFPQVIACVVGPIWLGFAVIAALFFADEGITAQSIAALLILICISPYFYLTLSKAQSKWGELDATRTALSQSQKQHALGKLVSGVAHDFNNILAVTLGAAELMKDASPAEKDKLADEIIKAADRGASLSAQLLAFGRRSQLEPAGHSVRGVFDDLYTMLDRVLPEHIATTLSVQPDTPVVFVDRHQLETALLNLAINARDAMAGGGALDIYAQGYALHPGDPLGQEHQLAPGSYTCIRVTDSGIGVPKEILKNVFDPFYTTKGVGEGSGLGLSMVLGFAKQSGGTVTFDSVVGQGSTVTLYLPSAAHATEPAPQGEDAQHWGGAARILLVEDETPLREVFARQLRAGGYDVSAAATGQEAETMLREGLELDILITDLVMPGRVQGHELARFARSQKDDLPVVMVSGYPDNGLSQNDPDAHEVVILRKPVRKKDLLDAVQKSLTYA